MSTSAPSTGPPPAMLELGAASPTGLAIRASRAWAEPWMIASHLLALNRETVETVEEDDGRLILMIAPRRSAYRCRGGQSQNRSGSEGFGFCPHRRYRGSRRRRGAVRDRHRGDSRTGGQIVRPRPAGPCTGCGGLVGRRAPRERRAKGLTQEALAGRSSLTQARISDMENGKQSAPLSKTPGR